MEFAAAGVLSQRASRDRRSGDQSRELAEFSGGSYEVELVAGAIGCLEEQPIDSAHALELGKVHLSIQSLSATDAIGAGSGDAAVGAAHGLVKTADDLAGQLLDARSFSGEAPQSFLRAQVLGTTSLQSASRSFSIVRRYFFSGSPP